MSSYLALGLTYCCCSASSSLCQSCFGSTGPGTTGRKRGVLLLVMAIVLAFWFQYQVAPSIVTEKGWIWKTYRSIPFMMGERVYHSWTSGCTAHDDHDDDDMDVLVQCAGNAGVYRPTSLAFLFFAISALATRFDPRLNREAWPAKYVIYFVGVLVSVLVPNHPLFSGLYLWIARLGAAVFVVLEQIILVDVAYNWNEDWVERSNQSDLVEYGSGVKWLRAVVACSATLYASAFAGIGLLYHYFAGCPENTTVITLTLVAILAMTGVQLSGTEGSLLTSSILSVYVTYLALTIVSKNPNGTCNPRLGHNDTVGIIIGLTLTALSLAWTGWSWSAENRLNTKGIHATRAVSQEAPRDDEDEGAINLDVPFLDPEEQSAAGMVMDHHRVVADNSPGTQVWKLNLVMALISCWVAMSLTGWGTLRQATAPDAANPTAGRVNMAIIGVSQWLAICLYLWTLLAPRLFPDREFS